MKNLLLLAFFRIKYTFLSQKRLSLVVLCAIFWDNSRVNSKGDDKKSYKLAETGCRKVRIMVH